MERVLQQLGKRDKTDALRGPLATLRVWREEKNKDQEGKDKSSFSREVEGKRRAEHPCIQSHQQWLRWKEHRDKRNSAEDTIWTLPRGERRYSTPHKYLQYTILNTGFWVCFNKKEYFQNSGGRSFTAFKNKRVNSRSHAFHMSNVSPLLKNLTCCLLPVSKCFYYRIKQTVVSIKLCTMGL